MRRLKDIAAEDRGDTLLEFALSAVVLFGAILGIMDCSRALFVYHFVSYAAQEGTRYAVVRGARWSGSACSSAATYDCDATAANVTTYVQSLAPPGVNSTAVQVTTIWPGTNVSGTTIGCKTANESGCLVQVKVSTTFNFIPPYFPQQTLTFTSTSERAIEQ